MSKARVSGTRPPIDERPLVEQVCAQCRPKVEAMIVRLNEGLDQIAREANAAAALSPPAPIAPPPSPRRLRVIKGRKDGG